MRRNGHSDAANYTLGEIREEVDLLADVLEDERRALLSELHLMVLSTPNEATTPSGYKTALERFNKWLKG